MANQYEVDPRQALFLKNYLDPKSTTFSNAYQSAIAAGYAEEYAKNILNKDLDWLAENIEVAQMLSKAEKNLDKLMGSEDERIQADISKFVAGRLGKKRWSERLEHGGIDGKDLPTPILAYVQDNNSHQEDHGSKKEDPGSSGGNIRLENNLDPDLSDPPSTIG